MMRWSFLALSLVMAISFASGTAWAQAAGGDDVVYKKKTVIDFSDVVIEGELTKPEGSYMVSRKLSRFSSLIRLRENFIPELMESHNEL